MYSIKVEKAKLLSTLRENLEKHTAEYDEAVRRYPTAVAEALEERALAVRNGGKVNLTFNLPAPQTYADEYRDAIEMLEWAEDESIELDQHEFKQYVQDEWNWKKAFAASTTMYNASR